MKFTMLNEENEVKKEKKKRKKDIRSLESIFRIALLYLNILFLFCVCSMVSVEFGNNVFLVWC